MALVVIALALGLNIAGLRDRLWPPVVDARTLLILPIEVRGQVEGADYAGRSFAEEVAMNLTQGKDLTILPVPEPGELGEERVEGDLGLWNLDFGLWIGRIRCGRRAGRRGGWCALGWHGLECGC